ncbi:MAG: RagB/SusD family nutrient uptake outer membrane protein [Croceitalea sp.]|nr:RagB/SusD family nutrient uptake outer membrane protein [Croceitalea sp.]NNC35580.1 RagB/SusD family nutrient uptake outer membrane protein [Croceitalea sp.]
MKRNQVKFYLFTLLAVVGLASCTDLEIEETDSFITEGFQGLADPASSVGQLYNQTYGQLGDQANTYALNEVTSDALLVPTRGSDWGDNGRWRKLHQHEWGFEETDILTPFNQWNSNQLLASQILDSRSNASAVVAAEASFLRAWAMYLTLDFFGQVPFRDTQLSSSTVPEVLTGTAAVDFIIADLDAAIAGLPAKAAGSSDLKRASKAAARFLKAKVLLNKHVFASQLTGGGGTPDAADMNQVVSLVDAIAAEGYALQAGYFDIFEKTADSETIWWAETGVGNRIFNGLHYNSTGLGGGGWNGFSTLAEYYDLFEGDPNSNRYESDLLSDQIDGQEERRGGVPNIGVQFTGTDGTSDNGGFEDGSNVGRGFLINQQYALDGAALTDRPGDPLQFTRGFVDGAGAPSLINNNEQTGIRVQKYQARFGGGFENHLIVFRYADAHLMKAEAILNGASGDATSVVNDVRTIRGVAPFGSVTASQLLDERGRELYAEGWRRNDMIRFGAYTGPWEFKESGSDDARKLFPIPLPQLLANPNLVQNPGY